jgi:dTDP-4-dehydrorhamnose 3,5-epimerase
MSYKVTKTSLEGVLIIEPQVFGDARGFFYESFNARSFQEVTGLKETFVQDNHSKSAKGVLRGLHYQIQHAQGKLVRVTQGTVFDVVVDIRRGSSTFGKWFGIEISAENKKQIWIPAGYAHGFMVISDFAEFLYKTTDYYYPEFQRSLLWCDKELAIDWPLHSLQINSPILSSQDANALPISFI